VLWLRHAPLIRGFSVRSPQSSIRMAGFGNLPCSDRETLTFSGLCRS